MREILFRGRRTKNGQWVEGDLCTINMPIISIAVNDANYYEVIPETVGQFTGLTDINGKKIFEGDIVEFVGGTTNFLRSNPYHSGHNVGTLLIVIHLPSGYTLCLPNLSEFDYQAPNITSHIDNYTFWNHQKSLKVVGNIHDNPELF